MDTPGSYGSAIGKEGNGMSDRTPLPTKAQLEKLLEKLLPANEEMDEVSASIILEEQGLDRISLAKLLHKRIEQRIVDTRAKSEDIPAEVSRGGICFAEAHPIA